MKIGIVGKGGVGKTTVAAALAGAYAARGLRVVAVETDSNPNLGLSLGLSEDEADQVPLLPRSLLVGAGSAPTAGQIMAEYGRPTPAGPVLMSAIKVAEAGAGCTCAGHASVRSLLGATLESDADVVIVDMEAGLEHLSRSGGTLAAADALVVVVEPTRKSVLTASRTAALAAELGITDVFALANKCRSESDGAFLAGECQERGLTLVGTVPFDDAVALADRGPAARSPAPPALAGAMTQVIARLAAASPALAVGS